MNAVVALVLGLSGLNVLGVLTVVLKGGELLGNFKILTNEVQRLRDRSDLHSEMLARAVAQLDDLERRVEALETERRRG